MLKGERRRVGDQPCHSPEVLGDGGERELVLSAARAAQSKPTQPQDALQMSEPHLNALAIVA